MSFSCRLAARAAVLLLAIAVTAPLSPASAASASPPATTQVPAQLFPILRIDVHTQGDRAEVNCAVWGFRLSSLQVDALCAATATAVYRREGDRETADLAVVGALRLKTDLSHQEKRLGEVELWLQPGRPPRQGNPVTSTFAGARISMNIQW